MRKSSAAGIGSAAILLVCLSSGLAGAVDEYKGMTYEKAASSIKGYGGAPVIAGRVGEYLPTEKCVISGSRSVRSLDSSGRTSGNKVMLYLNCNDTSALNGHPGNSLATPEGRQTKKMRDYGVYYSNDYAKAIAEGSTPNCASSVEWCKAVCEQGGTCSGDLMKFLGL